MSFAEELPVYASKVQQTIEPISKKIQNFQQSAGNLANDVHATKKVPEVRLQQSPTWPDYLVRGVGSVWGALALRINLYNNCREKCANLTSLGRRTSSTIL
jgi:hypothetical protein